MGKETPLPATQETDEFHSQSRYNERGGEEGGESNPWLTDVQPLVQSLH